MNYKKLNLKMMFVNIVSDEMREEFVKLTWFRNQIASMKRKTPEYDMIAEEINKLRNSIKNKAHSEYRVNISSGHYFNEQVYVSLPEPLAFKEVADDFINDIKFIRSQQKEIKSEKKNSLGFTYTTIGGVFSKAGEVKEIASKTDPMKRIMTPKTPHSKIKSNYLGFELELMAKVDRDTLNKMFINEKLAGYVHVKDDGSIRTEEGFRYPHEVTILCKEQDVEYVIERVCRVLNSKEVSAAVNNSCGFHLHIDMRNADAYKSYNNLVKSLPLLNQMVPLIRSEGAEAGRYCQPNQTHDLKHYYPDGVAGRLDRANRYQAVNPCSLANLKTLEVRLHSGTTNYKKIVMWAKICSAIAKSDELKVKLNSVDDFMQYVMRDEKFADYMNQRINRFSKQRGLVDTKMDHTLDVLDVAI